jgi:hypothetical protein
MDSGQNRIDTLALRLLPGQDLRQELDKLTREQQFSAACVITCVGSLQRAVLRLAGQAEATVYDAGPFEIVSLTGVMSHHGSHYHGAIANSQGQVIGGHILEGCLVYTTAELVIGILPHLHFRREPDLQTGYRELIIE